MKQFINTLKSILGYTVVIYWEGDKFYHYSWTRKDALSWMKAYPLNTNAYMYTFNALQAQRSA